jgi:hypothetical protein
LESRSGSSWKAENTTGTINSTALVSDPIFRVQAAENAEPTQPYFTRPSIEQPYYDLIHPEYRLRSFAPYPLAAWAEFTFDGLPSGHSFLDSWDAHYMALTETADPGQDAQRGGLLVAHPGKGTYIYVAYALYRQLPELVPGAYRLLANLLSAGQYDVARGEQTPAPRP